MKKERERERKEGRRHFIWFCAILLTRGFDQLLPISGVVVVTVFYSERGRGGGVKLGSARLSSFDLHVHVLR